MNEYTIPESLIGERLDKALTALVEKQSRSAIQKIINNGNVIVNGEKQNAHYRCKENDIIVIKPATKKEFELPIIEVIFEHDDFLVVYKPAGLLSQPVPNSQEPSLIDGLLAQFPELSKIDTDARRAGLMHRLDRHVSGLLLVARNEQAFSHFKKLFKERTINKKYIALVHGHLDKEKETITFPLARSKDGKIVARPENGEGRDAETKYEVTHQYLHHTLIDVYPKTGRMHQIRVHMKSLGHSIVGDSLYAIQKYKDALPKLNRIFLHATQLTFTDMHGQDYSIESPLPKELTDVLKSIK